MYRLILVSAYIMLLSLSAFSQVKLPISYPKNDMSEIRSLTLDGREQTRYRDVMSPMERRQQGHRLKIGEREIPLQTPDGANPTERQIVTIKNVLTEDFLVNDDTIGGAEQYCPSIAMDGSGNFVIVWMDGRSGNYFNSDIFFQRYSSNGVALGVNIKANDDAGIAWQGHPSIAMDGSGNFVIVWEDGCSGNGDIYFQCYSSNGVAIGVNTKANNDAGTAWQEYPSIAMDGSGNFVIVWQDYRNGNWDIYLQRFNSSGAAQGGNTKVNDDAGTADQDYPSIDMEGSGNFVIVWEDNRNGNWDIYLQRFNSSGAAQGVNIKVNDDVGTSRQYSPSIAMDGSGNFVIVWQDYRSGNYDIYFQRYSSNGEAIGVNTKANDDAGTASQWDPSIAMDGSGNFVIVWVDYRNGNSDIYYQRYNSSGVAEGVNTKADDDAGTAEQWDPSIAMDGSGNFVIVWQDYRSGNYDIYFQRYSSNGEAIGVNTKANNDAGIAGQLDPSIAMDGSGNFVIVWEDGRSGNGDIYFQRYSSNGVALGVNTKANDDAGIAWQRYPSIAMDGSGNFVIVWWDFRDGDNNPDIYYQRYNSNGVAQKSNTKVNDDVGIVYQESPSIAMDGSGNFVIVWMDKRSGNWDIYFQLYSSNGEAIGVNTKANNDAGTAQQGSPSISMDGSGNFVIVWVDYRSGNYDIYFQRYSSDGTALGVNTKANDDAGTVEQYVPSIATDGSGNFVIVWQDHRYGILNSDVIGQRYYANGTSRGANYRIVADGPNYGEGLPVVVANSTQIVFSWMDNRRLKGWDIYGKVVGWDWDGVTSVSSQKNIPTEFALLQNYPNPFNPNTNIQFKIKDYCHVVLKIHDVLGREVATLVNEKKEPGEYEVEWNPSTSSGQVLPTGVYIYKLTAGTQTITRKAILIK